MPIRSIPKNKRLKYYDYSRNGYYFVTLCTSNKSSIIQRYKTILEEDLIPLQSRFKGVSIDEKIFMDNHCHIIFLFSDANTPLSRVIQEYKSLTTLKIKRLGYAGKRFWQPNYYEHIIRSEDELLKIKIYIRANPYQEAIDWERIDDYIL